MELSPIAHPADAVFQAAKREDVPSSAPLLTEEVNALAASLNVPVGTNAGPYEPDAFVAAIRASHDKLMQIKAQLSEQNERQRAKELELKGREAAVEFRERRMNAFEQLRGLDDKRSLFERLTSWGKEH